MKRLWAPWRMPYIEQSEPHPACVLCEKAGAGDDEANLIVHRASRCFVLMNLYPYNSGHVMVIPYVHVGDMREIDPETGKELFEVTQLSVHVLTECMGPDAFNVGMNQGKTAGAGIADHVHLHVVPRWDGDTNFMPVLADAKVMPELLSTTAAKLRPLFSKYGGRA